MKASAAIVSHGGHVGGAIRVGVLALDAEAQELARAGALVYPLGADLSSVARRLYAGMRWLDAQGVDVILCRDVGAGGLGLAIRDRLRRAAARLVNTEETK